MASNVETLIRGAVTKGIGKVADFNRKRLPRPTDAHPFLTGIHKPMEEEVTLENLRIDGEIPTSLTGRYLRNGPNPAAEPDPAALALAATGLLAPLHAQAQAWPTKPVKVVVAFTAGGTTDILARAVGQQLQARFDAVVLAGNVIPLLGPGTLDAAVGAVTAHVAAGGVIIAGFGLDAGHLPTGCPVTPLAAYDLACSRAGLELADRFGTWDGTPFLDDGYAVSVHQRCASSGSG